MAQAQPAQKAYKNISEALQGKSAALMKATKETTVKVVSDRRNQVTAASAVGGAAVAGSAGAGLGMLACGTIGGAIGIVPAIFTLGLSIPIGTVIGGGAGVILGGAAGSALGLTGGGAVGFGAYTKRAEINSLLSSLATSVLKTAKSLRETAKKGKARALRTYTGARAEAASRVVQATKQMNIYLSQATDKARKTALSMGAKTKELVSDRTAQVTAASAAGGAVVVGTGGAATGLVAGGVLGTAVGLVPALFTFGLSIPVCAVLGGGLGCATGASVGCSTGATVGGAGGYVAFTKRAAIGSAATNLKQKAAESALFLRAKVTSTTGGTAE